MQTSIQKVQTGLAEIFETVHALRNDNLKLQRKVAAVEKSNQQLQRELRTHRQEKGDLYILPDEEECSSSEEEELVIMADQ